MIARISGKVLQREEQAVIIEVSGVGWRIGVARPLSFGLEQEATLVTQLHWPREGEPQLFGFATTAERIIFNLITSCSGMGPKLAMALLAELTPGTFAAIIIAGNSKALSALHGIGPKKAERLVIELKDKIAKLVHDGVLADEQHNFGLSVKLAEVLDSLGYARAEINQTLETLYKTDCSALTLDELIRKALALLTKRPTAHL